MKNMLSGLLLMGVAAALPTSANSVPFGHPIDAKRSGFVSVRSAKASCTAVAVGRDLLLAPASCIDASEAQHPELLGWFMDAQDSTENPVREVTLDPSRRFALLRLAGPLDLAVPPRRLFRAPLVLPKTVTCTGYGPQNPREVFPYDGTLSQREDYVISGRSFNRLFIDSPNPLTVRDLGAVCMDSSTQQIVAMLVGNGANILGVPLGYDVYGFEGVRAWVEEYQTKFEFVAEHSGLCLGNIPSSTLVWQMACNRADSFERINQRWMIRRIGDAGVVQIRPSRFPDLCLGVTGGAVNDGAEVRFSTCLPALGSPYPGSLPRTPRPEQVWAATHVGGDAIQLRNILTGKCLDVTGVERRPLARLQQWTCIDGQPNQRFMVNVDSFSAGTHQLARFYDFTKALGVRFGNLTNGELIISSTRNGLADQEYTMAQSADRAYQSIRTLANGSCIDVPAESTGNAGLQQWTCWGGANQQFMFRWLPQQIGYRIHPRHTPSRCLYVGAGAPAGSQLTSTPCVDVTAGQLFDTQRWLVE